MGRFLLLFMGVLGAVVAFSVIHGWAEYRILRTARVYEVVEGVERDLTQEELFFRAMQDAVDSIPTGVFLVVVLCFPLTLTSRKLEGCPPALAQVAGTAIGILFGYLLSIGLWAIGGGWGPPFLYPSLTAGAFLGWTLVAVGIWRKKVQERC